jgi:hypothetical protein
MKRLITPLLVIGVAFAAGALWVAYRDAARHAREIETQHAAWAAEKAELEAALERADAQARSIAAPVVVAAPQPAAPSRPSPADIIARLQALGGPGGAAAAPAQLRQVVYWLEELVQAGPAALPAIRQFLASNADIEFDTSWVQSRAARDGKLPADFVFPPSLRLGLFDVTRRIGGAEAEKLLADSLSATGRGLEVAYVTRLLQEMSPNNYRDAALSAARNLLANAAPLNSSGALDRYHRDYLFSVLSLYNDNSFASAAQTQLILSDGNLDRPALRYLQQSLGAKAVPISAQAYADPRLTDPAAKEPLARLALAFVGADAQANEFYQRAINDPVLTKSHRSNLIEDLNEHGFADPKNLTANDLPLIQSRIALIEQLAPSAMDEVNAAAFKEAYKDLVNMRARLTRAPNSTTP